MRDHQVRADDLLSTKEAAEILNRPVGTLRQWRHRRYGPRGFAMNGRVFYRRSALEAFIRDCEAAESGPGDAA